MWSRDAKGLLPAVISNVIKGQLTISDAGGEERVGPGRVAK